MIWRRYQTLYNCDTNLLLTGLRAAMRNISSRSWQCGLRAARANKKKSERGPISLSMAQGSKVIKQFIIWHSDQTCLFWICWLMTGLWPFPWKWSIRTLELTSGLPCHMIKWFIGELGNIFPQLFSRGPNTGRSVSPQHRANLPQ